jgi:hypothetical protein
MGFSRTGKASLVTSAILHHEGTKITKERGCGGAPVGMASELTETVHSKQIPQ